VKHFIALLLSSLLLLPSLGNIIVYAKFKINQDEIAKTICVQRKIANNSCNGNCELQKSLKKFSDNEKQMQDNLKEKSELVYLQNTVENILPVLLVLYSSKKTNGIFNLKPISVSVANFRPPISFPKF
jgi:plasmid maintenance system antidote protein VapI